MKKTSYSSLYKTLPLWAITKHRQNNINRRNNIWSMTKVMDRISRIN